MENLDEILANATSNIGENYFCLPRYEDKDVYRERHYCYELYHQMRCFWPSESELILSGEIDKNSHHVIRDLVGSYPIPDFLIHQPGSMNNDTIIEVKTANFTIPGVSKDFRNLSLFIEKAGYKRAIFLIFGNEFNGHTLNKIEAIYQQATKALTSVSPIELWVHENCGVPACNMKMLKPA